MYTYISRYICIWYDWNLTPSLIGTLHLFASLEQWTEPAWNVTIGPQQLSVAMASWCKRPAGRWNEEGPPTHLDVSQKFGDLQQECSPFFQWDYLEGVLHSWHSLDGPTIPLRWLDMSDTTFSSARINIFPFISHWVDRWPFFPVISLFTVFSYQSSELVKVFADNHTIEA